LRFRRRPDRSRLAALERERQAIAAAAAVPAPLGKSRRLSNFARMVLGCVTLVVCTAVAVFTLLVSVVENIAADLALGGKPISSTELTAARTGAPETIMIIGDDHIGKTTTYSTGAEQDVNGVHLLHADTFMLVRLDPAEGQVSIMSIPRDLLVTFTYHGQTYTGKFNSTYSLGRVPLALRVTKATLPGITINHVIDFNFASFLGLMNAIGCVYIDVDQYYYNPPGGSYQPIDIHPGYHRLCGEEALNYVRYRHTDSDFVRVARQQDFIRAAEQQLGPLTLLAKYNELAKAFGRAVSTDIRGTTEVAQLLQLAALSVAQPIRQVPFQVADTSVFYNGQDAVTSTPALIKASVDDFLYEDQKTVLPPAAHAASHHAAPPPVDLAADDLYPLSSYVQSQALALAVAVPFHIYLPSVQTGPAIPEDFHAYTVRDEQGHLHHGYRIDWSVNGLGGYYGIEGMNWTDPPLFANPSQTETIDGRAYMFIDDGAHIHDVGWREGPILYWVSNTLLEDLSNSQMIAIANATRPLSTAPS
jgi:LCP family protein required for cell wall assembly